MIRLRWGVICACVGLGCSTGDAAPGATGANTTTGSGPTTFATFSTTAPPPTTGTGTTDDTAGSSESTDGPTDTDTDTDTSADASTSTGNSGFCPSTHVCMEEAPEGWNGPVAVHQAPYEDLKAEPPACGKVFPDAATDGFEDLLADPAECSCECADPNGTACDNSTTLRYWADDASCDEGTPQAVTVFGSSCNTLPSEFPGNGHFSADPLAAVGGACAPSTEESIPPAGWTWRTQACEGAELLEDAACAEGRVCTPFPESPDAALCIWQEGEHECPEAFDATRTVFGDFEDARGCETCSCSAPTGLCDDAFISLWSGVTCLVPSAGVIGANGECDPSGSGNTARAASLNGGMPNAFCVPSEPTPSGEALGSEPITVCCIDGAAE